MSKFVGFSCVTLVLVLSCQLLANSGVQLPLSQYQAGTEQTTPVPNGNFESPGAPDSGKFPNPTGWTRNGNMYVAAPTFSNLTNTGSFAARLEDTLFPGSYSTPAPAMQAGQNYVLSAYVWNAGRVGAPGFGDLATVKIWDPANGFANNVSMSLEGLATDGGAGAGGYLMYIMLNEAQTASWSAREIQVTSEFGSVGGALPTVWSQYDNVALTLASDFVAQKWKNDADGNWSDNANWTGRNPNEAGSVVSFTNAITVPRTVTVDSNRIAGQINFNSPVAYNIAGTASITLQVTSDGLGAQQGVPEIDALAGNHTVSVPVYLTTSSVINVASGATLTLSNDLIGASTIALSKNGAGRLTMKNVRTGTLNLNQGELRILTSAPANDASTTSKVQALSIAGGPAAPTAKLDVANSIFIIDYTGATIIEDVRKLIQAGFNSGAWNGNGIASNRAASSPNAGEGGKTALGYVEGSTIAGGSIGGQSVDADSIAIKYTYSGDANLDGQVDITDLAALATAWQTAGYWGSGDFDYSGFVDITDLAALATNWQVGVGAPLAMSFEQALAAVGLGGVAVPEPATLSLGAGLLVALRRRRTIA